MADEHSIEYVDRKKLDEELAGAIEQILSAEEKAEAIKTEAEETVKTLKANGAEKERKMRADFIKDAAAHKEQAVASAVCRADAECKKLTESAVAQGEKLFASKKKEISSIACDLFASIGG